MPGKKILLFFLELIEFNCFIQDTFVAAGQTGVNPPTICGTNTGYHSMSFMIHSFAPFNSYPINPIKSEGVLTNRS